MATIFSKVTSIFNNALNALDKKDILIGEVAIPAVLSGDIIEETKTSDHAIELGSFISDHSVNLPKIINLTCCVSEVIDATKIAGSLLGGALTGDITRSLPNVGRLGITILEALRRIRENNELVTVVEKFGVHKNMQILRLKRIYSQGGGSRVDFEIMLRESLSSEVKYANVLTGNSKQLIDKVSSKVNLGRVSTTEATPDIVNKIKEQSLGAKGLDAAKRFF